MPSKKELFERDICTKYITPTLEKAGWNIKTQIREEVSFNYGRIIVQGRMHTHCKRKRADYILYYKPNQIETQVHPDKMEILSFPGPLPPIDNNALKKKRLVARDYRNGKISESLKELPLTEGRGTGFPIIYHSLQAYESSGPIFETDEDKSYFLANLFINPDATQVIIKEKCDINVDEILKKIDNLVDIESLNEALDAVAFLIKSGLNARDSVWARDRALNLFSVIHRDRVRDIVRDIEKVSTVLDYCNTAKTREDLLAQIGLKNLPVNFNLYIKPLINAGYIVMTQPEQPSSPNQRYRTTEVGQLLLKLIENRN